MKILECKITNLILNETHFIIVCDKKKIKSDVIDGSINISIETNEGEEVGYTYLEKNDIIKIIYKIENKEYIIPKKIYTNTKYDFLSEDSEIL
jgi:hypothetical protein